MNVGSWSNHKLCFTNSPAKPESFLSIPLTHRGHTLGALHLTNRKDHKPFTHDDLKTFAPITGEIAAILAHHEHFDGSGYPYGLRGDDISIPARILSVAEFYDSAVSDRPHRPAIAPEEAARLIREGASTSFDPDVAGAFLSMSPAPLPPPDATP